MQVVRTVVWVVLLVALLAFSYFNWNPVEVTIWQNLVLETKIPALVIISFLLGLVPMWLLHRASKWQMRRKIHTLQSTVTAADASGTTTPPPAERIDHDQGFLASDADRPAHDPAAPRA